MAFKSWIRLFPGRKLVQWEVFDPEERLEEEAGQERGSRHRRSG